MITTFNTQLFDISMNSATLANTVGANGQISYDYETGKLYVHDGYGGKWSNTLVQAVIGYSFQGTNYGYTSGGQTAPVTYTTVVDKFPFSTDTPVSVVGSLTQARGDTSGTSSSSHGYTAGGRTPESNVIDKFTFSSDANATSVGSLSGGKYGLGGHSSSSAGYASGGFNFPARINIIDKYPFASDTDSTNIASFSSVQGHSDQSSEFYGYASGGDSASSLPGIKTDIRKFSFISDSPSVIIAALSAAKIEGSGQSSQSYGYHSGGNIGSPSPGVITDQQEYFSFSSDSNGVDIAELAFLIHQSAGQSSSTSGYITGGANSSNIRQDLLTKFPFSSNTPVSDITEISQAREGAAGQQY